MGIYDDLLSYMCENMLMIVDGCKLMTGWSEKYADLQTDQSSDNSTSI